MQSSESMSYIEETYLENHRSTVIEDSTRHLQLQFYVLEVDYERRSEVKCSICEEAKSESRFMPFCCDAHDYCQQCMRAIVDNAVKEFKLIKCPHQSCRQVFDEHSPYFSGMPQQTKDRYGKILRNKQILTNPKVRLCAKPDCEGHYQTTAPKFICNTCKQQYCKRCLEPQHTGSCDKLIARGIERRFGFRKCPQCRMVVSRNEGCDHMTCLCSHQFCYKCGQSYLNGSHQCTKPIPLTGLAAFRWDIQNRPSALEGELVNLNNILYFLQPVEERSAIHRLIHILLFTIFLYPALTVLAVTLGLLAPLLYCGLAFTAILGYFLLLPIAEVCNLQLAPARFMRRMNVPNFIIRMLVLPLYPINFLYGIKDKSDFLTCESEKPRAQSLLKIVYFFLVLPLLMNTESE